MRDSFKHRELADFLQTRRKRLSPQEAGLKSDLTRRRTPGLRREEVAALSGISLTWYTSLEQGRPIRVSEQVLESLSRTLKLDRDEKSYLFALAGLRVNSESKEHHGNDDAISPSLRLILQELHRFPAYIMGSRWDIVAWNGIAGEIFGYDDDMTDLERNVVWRMFIKEEYRQLFRHWEYIAKGMLAQFRNFYGKFADDPWFTDLVELLSESSQEFRTWWPQHEVLNTPEGSKELYHPELGVLDMDYSSFMLAEDQRMILTVFTPKPQSGTLEKLEQLDIIK
ncbi:helix-turn-helix transcriptional regulator [Paenibacillus caui]|uniref:helix-turn-helix transcriptional regulator n=1 Tax=Paenibacillus caui TaxID=2873927 RepID=UPI001CA7CA24|nr:helix-turn-helix transcriptional regulator [Paenibacillus caui]